MLCGYLWWVGFSPPTEIDEFGGPEPANRDGNGGLKPPC